MTAIGWYRGWGKRVLDVGLAGSALVLASPMMLALGLLVRWDLGSPILFRQTRPGRYGRPFTLYKFRTMHERTQADGRPAPDPERLSAWGRRLRSTSLDELPELFNVVRGDMSLVGPRPLLMEYLERYDVVEARRHEVRPGLTGLAQVRGRNALPWPHRFRYDVWYVDHVSLGLDLRILRETLRVILLRRGINETPLTTMSVFDPKSAATSGRRRTWCDA